MGAPSFAFDEGPGKALIVAVLLIASAVAQGQTLTTLLSFTASGAQPAGALVQGQDGGFYGAGDGGVFGNGTIFRITPGGALTTLHSFNPLTEGSGLCSGLAPGTDGNFYGTLEYPGLVFRISSTGTFTPLSGLGGPDNAELVAPLTLGTDGNFYGTTSGNSVGCSGTDSGSCGTVFTIAPTGKLTTLYAFSGADGAGPVAALTLGTDGNFYGTTQDGGPLALGTVFRITPTGTLTTLHYFNGTDGALPMGGLALGLDGNFYGTTENGGDLKCPTGGCGTVFKMTPAGVLTTLHIFAGADGSSPWAGLTLGSDGLFYGTTRNGGTHNCVTGNGCGTVFNVNASGTLTTLYNFSGPDGENPVAALTLGTGGIFYGTAQLGGANGSGTFFSLNVSNSPLSVNANGVVNAASFLAPVAPGGVASVFGTFLISSPTSSTTLPLQTSLSGLSLQFGSAPLAPLFFASQSQLNVQIPWELAGQTQTTVTVSQDGQSSATQTLPLAMYSPGIFVMNNQTSQGAVLDANYLLVGPSNPTTNGAYIQIYCTGLGPVTSQPATGAPALVNPLSWTTTTPTVTIGGTQVPVIFSGLAPGEVGLYQVNVPVPSGATGPYVPLTISFGGVTSNVVSLAIR